MPFDPDKLAKAKASGFDPAKLAQVKQDNPGLGKVLDSTSPFLNALQSQDSGEALLTNKPTTGIKQDIVRGLPATAGMIPGATAGAAMGAPFGPVGMGIGGAIGAGIGAFGGEAARQAAVKGTATAFPQENFPNPSLREMNQRASEQGLLGAATEGLGALAKPALKSVGKSAFDYGSENLAEVRKWALSYAKENLPTVMKYVKSGAEVGGELAQQARDMLDKKVKELVDLYPQKLEEIANNPKYASNPVRLANGNLVNKGKTFNLASRLKDELFKITDEFQYDDPATMGGTQEAKIFNQFTGKIDMLKNATAKQAVGYLKMINQLRDKNVGTPLGQAFARFSTKISDSLGKVIPEIADANAGYSAGKTLESVGKTVSNANDLPKVIERIYSGPRATQERNAIDLVRSMDEGVDKAIEEIHGYNAAQQLKPIFRSLPQTGFGFGILAELGRAVGHGPAGIAAGATAALAGSPRAYLTGIRAAPLASAAGKIASQFHPAALMSPSLAALLKLRQQEQPNGPQ